MYESLLTLKSWIASDKMSTILTGAVIQKWNNITLTFSIYIFLG